VYWNTPSLFRYTLRAFQSYSNKGKDKVPLHMLNSGHDRNLIIIFGQEGVGKTTIISKLIEYIPQSAQMDAENLGQVNPWVYDEKFLQLLWKNVVDLTFNFWDFGYNTVITGSFFDDYSQFKEFRSLLPQDIHMTVIHLCANKSVRDHRREERVKPYNKKESDWVDENYPEDREFSEHTDEVHYIRIDTSNLSMDATISLIMKHLQSLDF
jgi:GTPase SAR1 family protein